MIEVVDGDNVNKLRLIVSNSLDKTTSSETCKRSLNFKHSLSFGKNMVCVIYNNNNNAMLVYNVIVMNA